MYMKVSSNIDGANLRGAWSQVAAVVTSVDTTLGKWLMETYGIGLTEYRAMAYLSKATDRELRINELANMVGLNQSSVTRLVGRLEGKEYVYRDTCPDDGRGVFAVITEHGIARVKDIHEPYESKISALLQDLATHYPQLDLAGLDRAFGSVSKLIS